MTSYFKNKVIFAALSLGIFLGFSISLSAASASTASPDRLGLAVAQGTIAAKEYLKSALIGKVMGAATAYLTTNGIVRFFIPELSFQQIALSTACFCALKTAYFYNKNYWHDLFKDFEKPEESCNTAVCVTAGLLPAILTPKTFCAAAVITALSLKYS